MRFTSDQLNQLIGHLKEAGPYILASSEDADFYRRAFKKPLKETEKKSESTCLLYTSPSPRDRTRSRMPSSA